MNSSRTEAPTEPERRHELDLLDAITSRPEITQADLATSVGVAVGTVNWYLKRWSAKGYVKVKRIGRWRWRYLLTPRGMAEKGRLAAAYLEVSLRLYRETRQASREKLCDVRAAGFGSVRIAADGELADICRLTCLEQGIAVSEDPGVPVLRFEGTAVRLDWPTEEARGSAAERPEL